MTHRSEPKLAPPGAGLPLSELLIGRMIFGLKRLRYDHTTCAAGFMAERAAIREMIDRCPLESRGKRVLIARPRGLEDSSRYWSVWMTLDHLRITNDAFSDIIRSLVSGIVPTKPASTANVKPDGEVTAGVDERYEESCVKLLHTVNDCRDLETEKKFAHPWFGPMDAAGWHTLSAGHMGIHREQLRRILAGI
jgi:hypothetical protein